MNREVLLVLNTNYHVETALSVYESLRMIGFNPTILLDHRPQFINPEILDYELKDFLRKYEIPFITYEEFVTKENVNYYKYIYISGGVFLKGLTDSKFVEKKKTLIDRSKSNSVLISHVADYSDFYKYARPHFIDPIIISVTNFSQRYGLNFFFQIENPIISNLEKPKPKDTLSFLTLGRFCWDNRNIHYIEELLKIDSELPSKIELWFIGQKPITNKFEKIQNQRLQNIDIKIKFDVSEIELYDHINKCDFIVSLIDHNFEDYFKRKFTSNINHIVAFNKPSLCFMPLNLAYNIPCIEYDIDDFSEKVKKCLYMGYQGRQEMSESFELAKHNMRVHNELTLSRLFAEEISSAHFSIA